MQRGIGRRHTAQGGYAYLALMISIAIIGVTAAAAVQLGAIYERRMAEKELLFVGGEFQRALLDYATASPLGQATQPRTLDDLLRDPRYPNVVRHLRKLYADPMTGKADWVLVKSPDGQTIVGIHSSSKARPIQIAHFPPEFQGFNDTRSYADWVFVARLPALTQGLGASITMPSAPIPSMATPSSLTPSNTDPSTMAPSIIAPSATTPFNTSSSTSFP